MNEDRDLVLAIAARGDGITADGRHVPLTAPGDLAPPGGSVVPGPHHQQPPCRHFPECGGCQLQHLDDVSYADFLTARIAGALAQHEMETDIRVPVLSPPRTRRRATLHAARRGRQVHLGFTAAKSHTLIDLSECEILPPALFALLSPLRGLLAAMLSDRDRANIHLTLADQGADVLIGGIAADSLERIEALSSFARRHKLARLSLDEGFGAEARWEPEPVTVTLGGVAVGLPAGGFLQATETGEQALVAAVREGVGDAATIADLFAGLGTFAFAMPANARVYAAEAAQDSAMALKMAANTAQRTIFADHRDLYRRPLTAEEAGKFDVIVLDPPRAGAKEQVAELARAKTPKIVHISCNPNTFARDAATLCEGGYRLDWIQPVGQFRWSTHVELAASFTR